MFKLPQGMKDSLDRLVDMLSRQEIISGIALFGSWSRGEAITSSDVDLLVAHTQNLKYEYLNRFEFESLLIDLNYIPTSWLSVSIPPEVDQKIFESRILLDKDGVLSKVKEWMLKTYRTPGRIDIRTEEHIISADTYLSRATSARARRDLQSARVFSVIAVEQILRILLEVSLLPYSNSGFIKALKEATSRMGMEPLFDGYLTFAELSKINRRGVSDKIALLRGVFERLVEFVKGNLEVLDALHPQVKRALLYYGNEAFLKGVISRSNALLEEERYGEALHYAESTLVNMLENYAWMRAKSEGMRPDSATLFLTLKRTGESDEIYKKSTTILNLDALTDREVDDSITYARRVILTIRKARKNLIKRYVK